MAGGHIFTIVMLCDISDVPFSGSPASLLMPLARMRLRDWSYRRRDMVEADYIDELKTIVDRNLADLSNVEQTVIKRRFNWQESESTPLTLEEVGKIIGVTKERVRQIQNKALAKIKAVMEEGVLRTKTDAGGEKPEEQQVQQREPAD
jgi:RNA polymerase sigma factor (sigma-70 family)